jgi:flagellar export protein FliJ
LKRFEFRLESVLRFRNQQAAAEESRLGALRGELQSCEKDCERLQAERITNKEQLLSEAEPMAMLLGATDSYSEFLQVRERFAAVRVRECQRKVDQQRLRLIEAQRQTKLIEKLKEAAQIAWRKDESREDDASAAEAHLAAFLHRRRRQKASEGSTKVWPGPHG